MKATIETNNQLKIPDTLARQLRWRPGRSVYVYPLNDGLTVRSKPSTVLESGQKFEQIMREDDVSLDELLTA